MSHAAIGKLQTHILICMYLCYSILPAQCCLLATRREFTFVDNNAIKIKAKPK